MGFITKVNLSENRFFKQNINSVSNFEGINNFSVPLDKRVLGPNEEVVVKEVIDKNVTSKFTYEKDTQQFKFTFGNQLMNESINSIIQEELTPYSEEVEIKPDYKGNKYHEIEGVIFYDNYVGYSFDMEFIITSEDDLFLMGDIITSELVKCDAASLDYNGDNVVMNVYGKLRTDSVLSFSTYNVQEINEDTTMSIFTDSFLIYNSGKLTILPETKIGWTASILSSKEIEFQNTNIEMFHFVNYSPSEMIYELIKISEDRIIIKIK